MYLEYVRRRPGIEAINESIIEAMGFYSSQIKPLM